MGFPYAALENAAAWFSLKRQRQLITITSGKIGPDHHRVSGFFCAWRIDAMQFVKPNQSREYEARITVHRACRDRAVVRGAAQSGADGDLNAVR
jgi:hypothetical protein